MNFRHLAIWNPGAAPIVLPHSGPPNPVAASARILAYDTGCRYDSTARSLPTYGGLGYQVCQSLRIYDAMTGRLRTFARPAGTTGWVPDRAGDGFWSFTDIAPSGRLMAAHAALAPAGSFCCGRSARSARRGRFRRPPPSCCRCRAATTR